MENKVKLFIGKVHTDADIYTKLTEASKSYDGEKTDEAIWENVYGPLAKDLGYDVTFDDFMKYVKGVEESRELSLDELENVAGGGSICWILGFGSVTGLGYDDDGDGGMGIACYYIGIGFGDCDPITWDELS